MNSHLDEDGGDGGDASFDASFDVSHISHIDSEDEADAAVTGSREEAQQSHQQIQPQHPHQPRSGSTALSLSNERAMMRERRSEQVAPDQSAMRMQSAAAPLSPSRAATGRAQYSASSSAAAAAPGRSASSSSSSTIPKLALSSLAMPMASSSSLGSRPSTSAGAPTTRSRLSALNSKLRAVKKAQRWWRDVLACREPRRQLMYLRRAHAAASSDRPRPLGGHLGDRMSSLSAGASARGSREQSLSPSISSLFAAPAPAPATLARGLSHPPHPALAGRRQLERTGQVDLTSSSSAASARPTTAVRRTAPVILRPFPLRATPQLRALVRGFIVRNVFAQKPAKILVGRISDTRTLMESVRIERAQLSQGLAAGVGAREARGAIERANAFLRSLQQQQAIQQSQLAASVDFHSPDTPHPLQGHSRIHFERRVSPRCDYDQSRPSTSAGSMLKRQSQRRFLKKKPAEVLRPMSAAPERRSLESIPVHPAPITSRPKTSAASGSQTSRASAPSAAPVTAAAPKRATFAPTGLSTHDANGEEYFDAADAGSFNSGSQTARSSQSKAFLKRRSTTPAAQKLNWSKVTPKVDNKLDQPYRAPAPASSAHDSARGGNLFDSVTGQPWEQVPGPSPISTREAMKKEQQMIEASRVRRAGAAATAAAAAASIRPHTSAGNPSGQSESAGRSVWKSSGSAVGDSAGAPDSPPASARHWSPRKSRHVTLPAGKIDLSHVKSRVDYASPYRAPDADSDEDDFNRARSASPVKSLSAKKKKPSAAPYAGLSELRVDMNSFPQPQAVSSARLALPSRLPRPKTSAGAVSNIKPPMTSRSELARLDAELAQLKREEAQAAAEWNSHSISGGNGRQQARPAPESESRFVAPPDDDADELPHSFSSDVSSPRRGIRSPAGSPKSFGARFAAPPSVVHSAFSPSGAAGSPPRGFSGVSNPHRLSQQELMINAEIASIEASLSAMTAFAADRGAGGALGRRSPRSVGVSAYDRLPEEWRRTVDQEQSSLPMQQASHNNPTSPHRGAGFAVAARSAAAAPAAAGQHGHKPSVGGLTTQFDRLSAEVNMFMQAASPQR